VESVAIVYHKGVSGYDFGPGHPLSGDQFPRFMDLIEDRGLLFAVYPVGVVFNIIAMQETLALCFALLSINYFRAHPAWSGLFLALAGQSRNEYWLAAHGESRTLSHSLTIVQR